MCIFITYLCCKKHDFNKLNEKCTQTKKSHARILGLRKNRIYLCKEEILDKSKPSVIFCRKAQERGSFPALPLRIPATSSLTEPWKLPLADPYWRDGNVSRRVNEAPHPCWLWVSHGGTEELCYHMVWERGFSIFSNAHSLWQSVNGLVFNLLSVPSLSSGYRCTPVL